jgi:hypothetical protein
VAILQTGSKIKERPTQKFISIESQFAPLQQN